MKAFSKSFVITIPPPLTCLYGNNELLWISVLPYGVFVREKNLPLPPHHHSNFLYIGAYIGIQ